MRKNFAIFITSLSLLLLAACGPTSFIEDYIIYCDGFVATIGYQEGLEGVELHVLVTEDKGTILFDESVGTIPSNEEGTIQVAATYRGIPTSPVTISVEGLFSVSVVTGDCDGSQLAQFAFTDGRINRYDAGSPVVLYSTYNGEGERGLAVYAADGSGLIHLIPPSTFAAVGRCPSENTTIFNSSSTGIIVSALPQRPDGACPYQVNAPTGEGTKTYIAIFYDLQPDAYIESYETLIGS